MFVDDEYRIDGKIKIVSHLNYSFDNPLNDKFYKKTGTDFIKDDFSHEIALVISEEGKNVLISGCFHSGVVNAISRAAEEGNNITHVVGGFHLSTSNGGKVSKKYSDELICFLRQNKIASYTGHCTGEFYLNKLQNELRTKVFPIYTGSKYSI